MVRNLCSQEFARFNPAVRVILFTRYPVAGEAKTRLIPVMGATAAAELQRRMTTYAVGQVRRASLSLEVRYTGGTETQMRDWLGDDITYRQQGEGDLGQRMARAFDEAFAGGSQKVLVVGCDCPANRAANLQAAVRALDHAPCVIGPARDGGYYLIGLTAPRPDLFRGIDWGTSAVLEQTLAKAGTCAQLPVLDDVDEREDIPPKISVIIPARNEDGNITAVVRQVLEGFCTEAIVVDGGSTDRTCERATAEGATVLASPSGRAVQMNAGAKSATGDVLLFLHADSVLPDAWDCHVRRVMKQHRTILGFFRFAIADDFRGRCWVEWATNIRSRLLKRPYGDQGLFLRRRDFFSLGGFCEVPIMEDVLLVKMARQRGPIQGIAVPLLTSGRRWLRHGIVKTTLLNQGILLAAALGVDLGRLQQVYCQGACRIQAVGNFSINP